MPKHARRARIVFLEPAATQIRTLGPQQADRLDRALNVIAARPEAVKTHATAPALRDYQEGGVRAIFYSTALGSIIIVVYVEAD